MDTKGLKYKTSLAFILLCSFGAGLLVAASSAKYGPGLTHDSAAYLYAAQSLLNGDGFQYFGYPSPYIQWPPLFPILLALGSMAGIGFGIVSTLINSLAFALTVLFAGKWMLENLRFKALAIGVTCMLFLSVPLLQVSRYLWTEIIFILFFLLVYIEFERFLRQGRYGSLALAALFSALACVDRYAGVTIVFTAALFLLFTKKSFIKRITDAAFYCTLSAIPMGIWVIRNYLVSGTLLGVRLPSAFTLRQNIKRSLEAIYTWVQPDKLLTQHTDTLLLNDLKLFAILLPIIVAAAFIASLARSLAEYPATRKLPTELKQESVKFLPIIFFTVYSVIYLVYLIASATLVAFEPINSRYLIPVYLPVLLTLSIAADYLYSLLVIRFGMKLAKLTAGFLLMLFLVYPALNTSAAVWNCYQNGAGGYASTAWHNKSGFLQYMKNDSLSTYYSNCAEAVYVLSGIRTYYPPKKSGPYMYGLEQFKKAVSRDESSYIIWFANGVPGTLYNLEELSHLYDLEEVGSFGTGKVYKLLK